jgi:hypothetical protein
MTSEIPELSGFNNLTADRVATLLWLGDYVFAENSNTWLRGKLRVLSRGESQAAIVHKVTTENKGNLGIPHTVISMRIKASRFSCKVPDIVVRF